MDTKSLSSRQVRWAQELSQYHFQIDYCQSKANAAVNTLSRFVQRIHDKEDELRAKNGQIFHHLQNLLTNASLAGLSFSSFLPLYLHQVLICGTYFLLQLCHFWDSLQEELASKGLYAANISGMKLRLQELQEENNHARKFRAKQLIKDQQVINNVLHHQGLSYIPEIIWTELISRHYNNLLAGHFGIKKTRKLLTQKYYQPMLRCDIEDYIKGCNICLALKKVRHKLYGDLQSFLVLTHCLKDLFMDFITSLPILTDWKEDSYDLILVIVDRLTKIVHYKPVKVIIDAPGLAEVIINVVVRHHGFPDLIVTDRGLLFTSKFWSLLCYFLGIKQKLSTAFHPQTDGQTKRQNSTMEAYL